MLTKTSLRLFYSIQPYLHFCVNSSFHSHWPHRPRPRSLDSDSPRPSSSKWRTQWYTAAFYSGVSSTRPFATWTTSELSSHYGRRAPRWTWHRRASRYYPCTLDLQGWAIRSQPAASAKSGSSPSRQCHSSSNSFVYWRTRRTQHGLPSFPTLRQLPRLRYLSIKKRDINFSITVNYSLILRVFFFFYFDGT